MCAGCEMRRRHPENPTQNRNRGPRLITFEVLFPRIEKHRKPHRGTKTMSAQVGESHASTVKRLSKSPTANYTTRRSTPTTIAFTEKLPAVLHDRHTSQKNMFSRAANFNCHDMQRTSLSSDTQTPLVTNCSDHWLTDCSTTGTRQHVECSQRVRIRRRIESGTSIPAVANCLERSWNRKGHASPRTRPARLLGNGQSRRVCEWPHLGKRQLIADIAHPTFTTESESFSRRHASLLNPMSVSSGLKRPHQKWMARDTCRSSSQSCRCTPMFGSGLCSTKYDTLPLRHAHISCVGKRCVPSATRPARQWVATTSQVTQEVGACAVP